MPVPTTKTPTGRIYILLDDPPTIDKTIIYARVSSSDQKTDLTRQVDRLRTFTAAKGWSNIDVVREIGSGLNGHRKQLEKILKDKTVTRIVVEHKDRLARFGVEYLDALLSSSGRQLVVVENGEQKLDLFQDFVDVVTSMCARIYGQRSAKNRARRALEAAKKP